MPVNRNLGTNDRALLENLKGRCTGEVIRYFNGKVISLSKKEDERLVVIANRLGKPIEEILA